MMRSMLVFTLACAAVVAAAAQTTKYGVTVTPEKNVDYTKFHTYAWRRGQPAVEKAVDAQITAAVDRELSKEMKKVNEPADVIVTYASLQRTDVDLKGKKDAKGLLPEFPVGTLIVTLHEPASFRQLLRMRVDIPIDVQRDQLEGSINKAVEMMFAEYPTRRKK